MGAAVESGVDGCILMELMLLDLGIVVRVVRFEVSLLRCLR